MYWKDWQVGYDLSLETGWRVRDVLRHLRPFHLVDASKTRVGRHFDGGYVMVDLFDDVEAAYSLGINDDVSWDIDIARLGIPVFQYDHTISSLPENHPLFSWQPICISGYPQGENERSLESLVVGNGHASSKNLLLKCNIEGAEWALLQATPNRILKKFSQIVIEIHAMDLMLHDQHADNVRRSIINLTKSHNVVHVHANNYAPMLILGGIPVPNVLEFTLMRKDTGQFKLSQETFPTNLDMPCSSTSADLYLGTFTFE